MKTAALSVRDSENVNQKLKGVVEIDRTSAVSWGVSVTLAMFMLAGAMFVFFLAASLGVDALKEKAHIYSRGVSQMIDWFGGVMGSFMPPAQIVKMKGHMEEV